MDDVNAMARWNTSSDSDSAETKPAELQALSDHLTQCSTGSGRLAALRCAALQLRSLVLSHRVTTLLLVAVVGSVAAFLLL
jgi:hypothetical protein